MLRKIWRVKPFAISKQLSIRDPEKKIAKESARARIILSLESVLFIFKCSITCLKTLCFRSSSPILWARRGGSGLKF